MADSFWCLFPEIGHASVVINSDRFSEAKTIGYPAFNGNMTGSVLVQLRKFQP